MKCIHLAPVVMLGLALLLSCSQPVPTEVQSGQSAAASMAEQKADRYTVRFATDPAQPKAGRFKFVVYVLYQNKPVDNATVKVQPEMPGSDIDVAELTLTPKGKGRYEAESDLRMKGDWQAKVSISDGSTTSNARFAFKVQ